jgi:hypothetical protein
VRLTDTQTHAIADRMVEVALDRIEDLARGRLARESYNLLYDALAEQIVPLMQAVEVPDAFNDAGELCEPAVNPLAGMSTNERYNRGLAA